MFSMSILEAPQSTGTRKEGIHDKYLTPWSRLFEKLTVAQLVKKFPTFYRTRKFITVFIAADYWTLS
jgi:hypothetical protein